MKSHLFFLVAFAGLFGTNLNSNAQVISTYVGNGSPSFAGDGGPATAAQINFPWGLAMGKNGALYFADYSNRRIRKIDASGIISTIAGSGITGFGGDGGPATAASLHDPTGVAVDTAGNVYFVDCFNERVRKISTSGTISTIAGIGVGGYNGDGIPATDAKISHPNGLAVDRAGNVYIPEQYSNRVRKIDLTGMISTIAGTGVAGYGGDGGPATSAMLSSPNDVALDTAGNVYVTEFNNQRVRKITPAGIITTVAGSGTMGFAGDGGPATAAELNQIAGLTIDTTGSLYICDMYNYTVRKVSRTGTITTLAGSGTAGYLGDGGAATAAQLGRPEKCVSDGKGHIYITELDNHVIRKVTLPAVPTSVEQQIAASTVSILPNPTHGTFTVTGSWAGKEVSIGLTNMLGQNLYSKSSTVTNGLLNEHIQLQGLPSGIYLLRLNSVTQKQVIQVLVEN